MVVAEVAKNDEPWDPTVGALVASWAVTARTDEFWTGMEDETGTGTATVEPLGVVAGLEPIAVVAICDGPAVTTLEVLVLVMLHTTVVTLLWTCVVITLVETGDVSSKKRETSNALALSTTTPVDRARYDCVIGLKA